MVAKRVVHKPEETLGEGSTEERVIATEVEIADSALSQAKGLMFRKSLPEEYALVLEVGGDSLLPIPRGPPRHVVHMLFVRVPLDVVWVVDDTVTNTATMRPWRDFAMGKADRIFEFPAGAAATIEPGDTLALEDNDAPEGKEVEGETTEADTAESNGE